MHYTRQDLTYNDKADKAISVMYCTRQDLKYILIKPYLYCIVKGKITHNYTDKAIFVVQCTRQDLTYACTDKSRNIIHLVEESAEL